MSGIRAQYYKETRELLPWWLGGMAAVVAGGFVFRESHDFAKALATLAFAAAACGLGGLAIGQEYSHRTLGGLLALPARRASVLGIKLLVLAAFLLSLGAAAYLILSGSPLAGADGPSGLNAQAIVAVLGCGFFLAPWLSMVGRGALAGMVFSIALPVASVVAVTLATFKWEWFDLFMYRFGPGRQVWPILVMLWAIGGVLTWTTFLRLQALDGSPGHIGLPAWLVPRPMVVSQTTEVRRRNPVWLMVRKELRLQQLAFAISATYVLVWAGFLLSNQMGFIWPLAVIHAIVIPVVIGGVASAEERHLGTASWQTLLPMASAWQWTIKAGVAVLLTAVLVPGMPFLLSRLGGPHADIESGLVMAAVCGCVVALYISSVTNSGIRAILTAGLAMIVMFSVGNGLWGALVVPTMQWLYRVGHAVSPFTLTYRQISQWTPWVEWLQFFGVVVGGTVLLLRFGAANHRSGETSRRRIGRQIAWAVGYMTVTALISSFALQVMWAAYRTPRVAYEGRTPPAVYSLRLQPVGAAAGEVRCLVVPGSYFELSQAFRCPSVPPGDFRLLVTPRANAPLNVAFGNMPLTVEGRDLTTIRVGTAPEVAVNGRVVAEGGRALPAGLQVVTPETTYQFAGRSMTAAAVPPATVGADGSFQLPGGAGPRVIRLQNLPPDWTLKFVSTHSNDTSDASTTWLVVITPATGTVAGTVLTADRRPARDALVIVFPSDEPHVWRPMRWSIRMTPVGAGGRYSVEGLLPGAYRVAFVQGMADGAWDDPDVITTLRPESIPLTISADTRATIDGTIPRGRPR